MFFPSPVRTADEESKNKILNKKALLLNIYLFFLVCAALTRRASAERRRRIIFVLSLVLFTFSPTGRKRMLSRLDFDILVQLQFPIQLPCFNFTTITNPYLGVQLFTQKFLSEIPEINFNLQLDLFLRRVGRDVHSTDSDSPWRSAPRLLPNPDSRRRVAAFDPY